MRTLIRVLGGFMLLAAGGMALLGIISLPPGGLMFALPFVLFGLAAILALIGAVLLKLSRIGRPPKNNLRG
jgi:hypothetical protein